MPSVIKITVKRLEGQSSVQLSPQVPTCLVTMQYSADGITPLVKYIKEVTVTESPFNLSSLLLEAARAQIDVTITTDGSVVLGEIAQGASLKIDTPASVINTKDLKLTEFIVQANKIALTKSICAKDIKLKAERRIDNLAILASEMLDIHSHCIFHNYGEIITRDKSRISVWTVYNHNKITAAGELYTAAQKYWVNKRGASLIATGPVSIFSKSRRGGIINLGEILTNGRLSLHSMGLLVNRIGGVLSSQQELTALAKIFVNSGYMHSRDKTRITCDSRNAIFNTVEGVIDSDADVGVCANGAFNNYGKIKGHKAVAIRLSGDLANLERAGIGADLQLILSTASSVINEALIESSGSLDVVAKLLTNTELGVIAAATTASLVTFTSLHNAGKINASEIRAYVGSLFQTVTGEFGSSGSIKMTAWSSIHNEGLMRATLDLLIKCYGEISNVVAGKMYAGRYLVLSARQIANEGTLESKQALLLKAVVRLSQSPLARALAQQSLTMLSTGNLTLAGEITSHGEALLKASAALLAEADCNITSDECLQLVAGELTTSAIIKTDGQLLLKAVSRLTQFLEGKITGEVVHIDAWSAINCGTISAAKQLIVELGANFTNLLTGILQAGTGLELTASMLENSGDIQSFGKMQARIANIFINFKQGKIIAKQELLMTAGMVLENAGKILGESQVNLQATGWFKQLVTGTVTADSFKLDSKIVANFGRIEAKHKLHIKASSILQNYTEGRIVAIEALTLIADSLTNAGELKSETELTVNIQHILQNHSSGKITAQRAMDLLGATIVVNAGEIISFDSLTSQVQICLTNTIDAKMTATKALQLLSDFAIQNQGLLQAEKIYLAAKQFLALEQTSLVDASKEAQLKSSGISQVGIVKAQEVLVTSDWLMNCGEIQATKLDVNCQEAIQNLYSGKITVEQAASIITKQGFINLGSLVAKERLRVIAEQIFQCGTIGSLQNIYLKALDLMLHGDVQAGGGLLAIVDGDFTYQTAALKANGDITLTLKNGYTVVVPINTPGGLKIELTTEDGKLLNLTSIATGKDLTINVPGNIIINGDYYLPKATMQAGGEFSAVAREVRNTMGEVIAPKIAVTSTDDITNSEDSALLSTGDMKLVSTAGTVISPGKLKIGGILRMIVAGKLEITYNIEAQDIFLQSVSDDVEIISKVTRKGDTENFDDAVTKVRIMAKNILCVLAGKNVVFTAAETESGLGTYIGALANIIDKPVELVRQRIQHLYGRWSGTVRDTDVVQSSSQHKSARGDISMAAEEAVVALASSYESENLSLISGKAKTVVLDVTDVHETESHIVEKTGTWYGGTKRKTTDSRTRIETSRGAKFIVPGKVSLTGDTGIIVRKIHSIAKHNVFNALHGPVTIEQGADRFFSERREHCAGWFWQHANAELTQQVTYSPSIFLGTIEVNATKAILELVRGKTLAFMQRMLQQDGGVISYKMLEEQYHHESHSSQGPTAGLSALVSLAVGIATCGTGTALAAGLSIPSGIGTAMFTAGFSSLCGQAAIALLANEGNPFRALESLTQASTVKSLATAILSAGVMHKIVGALHLPKGFESKTLEQHVKYNLARSSVNTVLGMGINGQDGKQAILSGLTDAAVNAISSVCAQKIGELYQPKQGTPIDPVTHKILHAAVGGASGAVLGGSQGATSGALGALVAETAAEVLKPEKASIDKKVKSLETEKGRPISLEEFNQMYSSEIERAANCSKLVAASVALLAQQDVSLAIQTATTALEHNFMQSAAREMARAAEELAHLRDLQTSDERAASTKSALEKQHDALTKKELELIERDQHILTKKFKEIDEQIKQIEAGELPVGYKFDDQVLANKHKETVKQLQQIDAKLTLYSEAIRKSEEGSQTGNIFIRMGAIEAKDELEMAPLLIELRSTKVQLGVDLFSYIKQDLKQKQVDIKLGLSYSYIREKEIRSEITGEHTLIHGRPHYWLANTACFLSDFAARKEGLEERHQQLIAMVKTGLVTANLATGGITGVVTTVSGAAVDYGITALQPMVSGSVKRTLDQLGVDPYSSTVLADTICSKASLVASRTINGWVSSKGVQLLRLDEKADKMFRPTFSSSDGTADLYQYQQFKQELKIREIKSLQKAQFNRCIDKLDLAWQTFSPTGRR